jgi:hypothetical protein
MKVCCTCKEEKTFELFGKLKSSKDGYRPVCKDCRKVYSENNKIKNKEYKQKYYHLNKEKCNEKSKNWYLENLDFKKEYDKQYVSIYKDRRNEVSKKWRIDNIEKIREYKRNYYHTVVVNDPDKMIRISTRSLVKRFLKVKNSTTNEIIGCSYEYLRKYLESKFQQWMTWSNHGLYNGELNYGWDIDHIIPLSSAKTDEDVIKLNHYTNLQPLCSKINRDIKRDKLNFDI